MGAHECLEAYAIRANQYEEGWLVTMGDTQIDNRYMIDRWIHLLPISWVSNCDSIVWPGDYDYGDDDDCYDYYDNYDDDNKTHRRRAVLGPHGIKVRYPLLVDLLFFFRVTLQVKGLRFPIARKSRPVAHTCPSMGTLLPPRFHSALHSSTLQLLG